ncbi:MAG: hypothetical protein ACQETH_06700 [Candidatus Rifleibacteriota bacterium]
MQNFKLLILLAFFLIISISIVSAQNFETLFSGKWGSENNELGISFPARGVLPIAPYMCIGGFDVDPDGRVWFSDSVNRKIKSWKNKQWRYAMVSCEKMGDLDWHAGKLYVISRKPDGFIIFDTKSEKVEKIVKVPFQNPLRIVCLNKDLVLIEEQSGGIWVVKNEQATKHHATSLEACGISNLAYGMQLDLISQNRQIIKAELSEKMQEPEMVTGLEFEPDTRVVFSKMAGMVNENPVAMIIKANAASKMEFLCFNNAKRTFSSISLPVLPAPYLLSSWKLCSDGKLYGFKGDAKKGFKVLAASKNFSNSR